MCLVTLLFYFIVLGNKRGIWERDEKIAGYGNFREKEGGCGIRTLPTKSHFQTLA